ARRAGRVIGVTLRPADGAGAPVTLAAPAVLLAGGGAAGLYAVTTNPPRIRGEAAGMAARAGAAIVDAEFVQFHPTALDVGADPAPLATEALRGEGATLIDAAGARFMPAAHPDAELAPRDVVARAVFAEWRDGGRPMLDARAVFARRGRAAFPALDATCARHGIDPAHAPIPVAPATHYHMGGVATDAAGRSGLPGLWVCGEAAATGLHGANRLASNGLLEALVFARFAADDIAATLGPAPEAGEVALRFAPAAPPPAAPVAALRQVMSAHAGVVRDAEGLRTALAEIARLEAAAPDAPAFANMTATATLIAASALLRRESRGAHYRADFPRPAARGARRWLTLTEALALRSEIVKETRCPSPDCPI
ncbi:L-aspartate oxidase, partial [Rhodobacteraceae bacterium WD3A24]